LLKDIIYCSVQHYFSHPCIVFHIIVSLTFNIATFTRCTSKSHERRCSSAQQILFCWMCYTCRLIHLRAYRISGSPCYKFHAITPLITSIDRIPFFVECFYRRTKICMHEVFITIATRALNSTG